jgi:hypothetical protein
LMIDCSVGRGPRTGERLGEFAGPASGPAINRLVGSAQRIQNMGCKNTDAC